MAAAVFNYTIDGVPLLFNGEEVANVMSSDNTHNLINWNSPNAAQFTLFYTQLIGLRSTNPALQQGALTWGRILPLRRLSPMTVRMRARSF